jgi:hypothetical protein
VDCLFLFCAVVFSALPYLSGLGFYSDDWATLASSASQSTGAMIRDLLAPGSDTRLRPVQVAYLVSAFKGFGRNPIPYHIVGTAALGLTVVLLYLVLTRIRVGRVAAFSISLLFGLLPHYSTDRIWISSLQAVLCMAFALLGTYALLRLDDSDERSPGKWAALASVSFVLSLLSYEIAIGWIGAAIVLACWQRYRLLRASPALSRAKLAGVAVTGFVIVLVCVFKFATQKRLTMQHRFLQHFGETVWNAVDQALRFNLWTYGLDLYGVVRKLFAQSAISMGAVIVAIVIGVSTAAYIMQAMKAATLPSVRKCALLVVAGFGIFALGFALFFAAPFNPLSSAGIANRVAIAAAPGAACVSIGIVGALCGVLPSPVIRLRTFGVAVGLLCGLNSLVVNGIGFYWVEAANRQAGILCSVATNIPPLPKGSVLLLDGFCRYTGPGVVFETDWDATGGLRLALKDFSLTGDVVSSNARFNETAVDTTMYGTAEGHYPYGDQLFVFNVKDNSLTTLKSKEDALRYLRAMNSSGHSGCAPGVEGDGTKVF